MSQAFAGNPEFSKLLVDRDDEVDLVRLLLEFAGDAYPGLDAQASLAELARLGRAARERLAEAPGAGLTARLETISDLLASEGFHGDRETYYDPRNSYLNEVLARRQGIPISLAMVYVAVGRHAGLTVYGVGTPGHFIVGCRERGKILYVDPFTDGAVLDEYACRERIAEVIGKDDVLTSEHFRPATAREIAARVLRNLKAAYATVNDWPAVLPVQLRLAALLPELTEERRDLGLIYLRNNDPHPAVAILEEYVAQIGGEEAAAVLPFLKTARRLAAERN